MTRDYELGFILTPEVSEEQTRAILDRVQQVVTNYGGQIIKVNQWGRRRLAYPIQHQRDGYYVFIDMVLTPETPIELDRTLKVSEEVLRHMITKRDPKSVLKERAEREEREARAAAQAQAQATAGTETTNPGEASAVPGSEVESTPSAIPTPEEESEAPAADRVEAVETPTASEEDVHNDAPPAIEENTEA